MIFDSNNVLNLNPIRYRGYLYCCILIIKQRKVILLACKDAVELSARAIKVSSEGVIMRSQAVKDERLMLIFFFNGHEKTKISGAPDLKRPFINYNKLFRKYENKVIRILYSPYYDHVLLLKTY